MQAVRVKGVANPMQFPDDMDIEDIKAFLQKRFANMAVSGESTVDVSPRQATAQAYKPTLQERFSQGIGNTLTSTGLVDDNYQAQNIGKNIGNIAAFSPVGSAFGGDEFGKALKEDDKLGMALGALEAGGVVGDIGKLAIFGGIMAKGADLKALARAKKLESGGADRDEIWKETGWANDRGDWKFEISDHDARYNPENLPTKNTDGSGYKVGKLPDSTSHPEMYEAYPELRSTDMVQYDFKGASGQGEFRPASDFLDTPASVTQWDFPDKRATNLHEIQHNIQEIEGFSQGGSPSNFNSGAIAKPKNPDYDEWLRNKPYIDEIDNIRNSPEYRAELSASNRLWESEYKPRLDALDAERPKRGSVNFKDEMAKFGEKIELIFNAFDAKQRDSFPLIERATALSKELKVSRVEPDKFISNIAAYKRLAGEAESRNVERRMNWTPEQRRETPPWKTLDVPEDELIYRKSGGKSMSANEALGGVTLSRSDKVTNQYGDNITAMDIISEGKPVGSIEYIDGADSITILRSDVEDNFAGKGIGTNAYEQLITKALADGKTVKSDATVSPKAQRVYDKLKEKGFNVTKADNLSNVRAGETTISRESRMAQRNAAPLKTLPDGTRTNATFRMVGEPVYTIEP